MSKIYNQKKITCEIEIRIFECKKTNFELNSSSFTNPMVLRFGLFHIFNQVYNNLKSNEIQDNW